MKKERGFSPVEMIIALVIITLFISVLAYKYYNLSLEGNISVAKTEIKTLRTMVKFFRFKYNRYPKNLKELADKRMLAINGKDGIKREYEHKGKLLDPFGNYYIYDNRTGKITFSKKTIEIIGEQNVRKK